MKKAYKVTATITLETRVIGEKKGRKSKDFMERLKILGVEQLIEKISFDGLDLGVEDVQIIEDLECPYGDLEDEDFDMLFKNHYKCPKCNCRWEDEYECMVDDDCPKCGLRHISPWDSEQLK